MLANMAAGKQRGGAKAETPAARSHAHLHPQSHPFAHRPPALGKEAAAAASANAAAPGAAITEAGAPDSNVAAVRLRGLPFSMSVQDVLAFFAQYDVADRIADGPQAAQLLPKANGRPSGQARVQMRTRLDAEVVQNALHHQWIGGRYIEVFVYGEETEQQVNDFNAQLGFPAGHPSEQRAAQAADPADAAQAWQRAQGFPSFPPMQFPGAHFPPMMGAPPWAQMVPPAGPVMPGAGVPAQGADGTPQLGQSLDTLFSFLYTDNGQRADGGAAPAGEPAGPRSAVQV